MYLLRRRVTMEAAVPSIASADLSADVLEDFEARGGGGGRRPHSQQALPQHTRTPAPSHVSLLSRAIPRSVFADSQVWSCCALHVILQASWQMPLSTYCLHYGISMGCRSH